MKTGYKLLLLLAGLLLAFVAVGFKVATSQHVASSRVIVSRGTLSQTQTCTAADFSLSKLKASVEYDDAKLTGIVTSHCAAATGVQLKWTAFNADGTVAFSSDFWPASTTNIPPHTDYPFEMMNAAPRGKWTYRVQPIKVEVW